LACLSVTHSPEFSVGHMVLCNMYTGCAHDEQLWKV
jgi:hypothetical protein